ncbi:helix-turn-helix domain-containing protein [Aliiglaciecola sp.]|nr:helix-turn-helix domain-containing protein [Aliiglaciecola sp.]
MSDLFSSMFLLLGIVNGAIVFALLLTKKQRSQANWILGLFIMLVSIRALIYILSKGQIFDPVSWLYVPPIEISLAYGPCLFLYFTYLTQRHFQVRDLIHFIPVALQTLYYLGLFHAPTVYAEQWILNHHITWVAYTETLVTVASMTAYLLICWHGYQNYQLWLDDNHSDSEDFRLTWLNTFLGVSSIYSVIWAGVSLSGLWIQTSYQSHFLLFAVQSILLCLLSFESWRFWQTRYPPIQHGTTNSEVEPSPINHSVDPQQANKTLSQAWLEQVIQQQCWREPGLSLGNLAQRLGTDTKTLSYIIRAGRQENFNAVINRLRIEYVCDVLGQKEDLPNLVDLASDAGFHSQRSFKRNFKRFTGVEPEQYTP